MIKFINLDNLDLKEKKEINDITSSLVNLMFIDLNDKQEYLHLLAKDICLNNTKPYKIIAFLNEIKDKDEMGFYFGFLSGYFSIMGRNKYHENLRSIFWEFAINNIDDMQFDLNKILKIRESESD